MVTLQRTHDQAIMDLALRDQQFTESEQVQINCCRMYLRKTTIADWPHQPRPGPLHRKTWQQYLRKYCQPASLKLIQPLTHWNHWKFSMKWKAYFDLEIHSVMIHDGLRWHHYQEYSKHRRYWRISRHTITVDHTPPHQLINIQPVDLVAQTQDYYDILPPIINIPIDANLRPITTWTEYQQNLIPWERQCIQDAQTSLLDYWIQLQESTPTWSVVSDGSYKNDKAAYAWIVTNGNKIIQQGTGTVSRNPITAFRAELHGLVAWYPTLWNLSLIHI